MLKISILHIFLLIPLFSFAIEDSPLRDFPGCPENSFCSKSQGQKYLRFKEIIKQSYSSKNSSLINKFINDSGAPITGWTKSTHNEVTNNIKKDSFLMSVFDSPCPIHRKEITDKKSNKKLTEQEIEDLKNIPVIYSSEIFLKGIIPDNFIPHYIFLKEDQKISKITSPFKNIPFVLKNGALIFLMEHEGFYFNYNISRSNKITIDFNKYSSPEIINTECSKDLVDNYKNSNESSLYEFFSCKSIWSEEKKAYVEILYGMSC